MRIVDLIFYAFSKARFPEKKGSIFDAVIYGFCFPVALTVATVIRFACKLCLEKNQQGDFCHISGAYQLPNLNHNLFVL